jgi:quercetin dioxygenase-like cupin family protein
MPQPHAEAKVYRFPELPADRPMELLERRRVHGEHITVAQIRLERGCQVPLHQHENEQFSMIVLGRLRFEIGAEGTPDRRELVLLPGELLHLPPNVPHSAYAEEETLVLDLFSPPAITSGIDQKPRDAHG